MSKGYVYVLSVDFRPSATAGNLYRRLLKEIVKIGVAIKPTKQMFLLVSPLSAKQIRDHLYKTVLRKSDRAFVAKLAKSYAWRNSLPSDRVRLKVALKHYL